MNNTNGSEHKATKIRLGYEGFAKLVLDCQSKSKAIEQMVKSGESMSTIAEMLKADDRSVRRAMIMCGMRTPDQRLRTEGKSDIKQKLDIVEERLNRIEAIIKAIRKDLGYKENE